MAEKALRPSLMVVHAHPDDECITMGGSLARYSAAGVRTVLVTCTSGEVGGISDPGLASPGNLAEVRLQELALAARILGIERLIQLGYRDSGLAGDPSNGHPESFFQADTEEATLRMVRLIRQEQPHVVATHDGGGGYGHPDHIKAHQVAVAAFHSAGDSRKFPEAGVPWQPARVYFAVFPRRWAARFVQRLRAAGIRAPDSAPSGVDIGHPAAEIGTPDELVTTAVNVWRYADIKRRALAAHRTQLAHDHFLMLAPAPLLRELWTHEYFQRAAGPTSRPPGKYETDLFSGLDLHSSTTRS